MANLPAALSLLTRMDPLAYGIDGIRGTLISATHFGLALDTVVLCAAACVFLAIGTYCFSRIEI